jgi:hypothetical protein
MTGARAEDGSVPADLPRDPEPVRQHRPGWHARDIAVEKAGQ